MSKKRAPLSDDVQVTVEILPSGASLDSLAALDRLHGATKEVTDVPPPGARYRTEIEPVLAAAKKTLREIEAVEKAYAPLLREISRLNFDALLRAGFPADMVNGLHSAVMAISSAGIRRTLWTAIEDANDLSSPRLDEVDARRLAASITRRIEGWKDAAARLTERLKAVEALLKRFADFDKTGLRPRVSLPKLPPLPEPLQTESL
jgi:hypothetical protein